MVETVEYVSCTETAKLIRSALKTNFPNTKFFVRSDKYAGGASIRVAWFDGPEQNDVDEIVQPYRGADFDGMTDCKNYRVELTPDETLGLREVHYGADFVFTTRRVSR